MKSSILCLLLSCLLSASSLAAPDAVEIPCGVTPLGDIGIYQVAYQNYGKEPVLMPPGWRSDSDPVSGIVYAPGQSMGGREAILLHSPWRNGPGKVWVDYRLLLPELTPLTLSFGIIMDPVNSFPDRSDGVTFGCYLIEEGKEKELLRYHHASGEWKDYTFDLTPWAGKEITLRIQAEPGPAKNSGWDFSYFGDAKITAGSEGDSFAQRLESLLSSKSYTATASVPLDGLRNHSHRGILPSNALDHRNTIQPAGKGYRFSYEGGDCRLEYQYVPQTGTLEDFSVRIDEGDAFAVALGGGITAKFGEAPAALMRGGAPAEVGLSKDGRALRVLWDYPSPAGPLRCEWRFGIIGKALSVQVDCANPVVSQFSLGNAMQPLRKSFRVPYYDGALSYYPSAEIFGLRALDWTVSNASQTPNGTAHYHKKTDGTRNPVHEAGFIAFSPDVREVLPNIPHEPSPYRDLLGPKIMLDIWGHHKGTYQGDAENLRALKDNGVDHVAIISHVWQRFGYDVKLPDHLPANPQFGGDEGMIEFGKAANECGYVWSLHENYIDIYPDAPSYDPAARVLRADGSPSPAWFNQGTGVQSYGLKCNRALGFAKQNAPEIHKRFKTNAAYLDVHTCVPPWHQLDYEANQPMAAMARGKVKFDSELFQYMQATHEGPLFGEGANHFYWAGLCDGVEAQVRGGEHHTPLLDFDLLKIHPQMVNHGMGYYERWFEKRYGARWGQDAGTVEHVDKYRAMEVAYGHAGFIGNLQTNNIQWVAKEHHLMHPIQRLAGAADVTAIHYEVDGAFVSASVALIMGERWRQRIRYDSGLTVWVNWREEPWKVEGHVLPQWGFLAKGPGTEVWMAQRDGLYAEYAECPEFLFADARTAFNMPYVNSGKDVEPRLAHFEHLGGGRIRLTYEWVVNDTFDRDCVCFVHFINKNAEDADIIFQQDHGLPKPTSQWKKGETITDGPYEVTVPIDRFDTYDIVIGLHKGGRVPLKGISESDGRILIGRLRVQRDGDKITDVALEDFKKIAAELQASSVDFTARLNPEGSRVNFGKIATSGSVKVSKERKRLVVFPYPRDRKFPVSLNMTALAPNAFRSRSGIATRALAAGSQDELGVVKQTVQDGWLSFETGVERAGRYVVEWE